jgi:uncharacterized protein YbbC (DUF1343 family)/CubicO group peptidase (beta-lactamase class C family)
MIPYSRQFSARISARHLALLFFLIPALAQAATAKKPASKAKSKPSGAAAFARVDAIMEESIAHKDCPGAVLVVGHHGRIVYRKAYGMRSLEPVREAMTLDTIFDIASLSKVVATTPSVLRMFELGQFRLNDPVSRYLPEFAQNDKQEVTIRELLTHYSGLREDLELKTEWSGEETAKQMAFSEKLVTPPGSIFRYSDINFEVLGFLVEKLSQMSLDKYANAFVFQPLGMKDTSYNPPASWRRRIAPTEYDEHGQMLRGVVHDPTARRMGGVAGHAGVFSTGADLAKYAQAVLDAANYKPGHKDFLNGLTVTKAIRPQQPPNATSLRGLGWDIDTAFSSNRGEVFPTGSFGHTGFTGTSMWLDPFTDTYVILLTNAVHPHRGPSVIALRAKVATLVAEALNLGKELHDRNPLLAITGYNEAAAGARRMTSRNATVLNGIDVLEAHNFEELKPTAAGTAPRRIGVLTNQTGIDAQARRDIDVLNSVPGIKLAALFSPEHGVLGKLDTTTIGDTVDAVTGIPVYSVYGNTDAKRRPQVEQLKKLDAVVVDIQDAGVRYYTYETSMGYFLEAAAQAGIEVIVLDRPDPITGAAVGGPITDPGKESFVSYYTEPSQHGMTMGELARFFVGEKHLATKLTVVQMQGWQRGDWFDSTGQAWVNPSPNLRSVNEATLYPGVGLIEGGNISVGRGTDTPFEVLGAPWIKPLEFASYLNNRHISGVRFVPVTFTPSSSNYANQQCGGVNIVVLNRYALDAPELGLELANALHKLYASDFQIQKIAALVANAETMDALNAGTDPRFISSRWNDAIEKFEEIRKKYLIYK